MSIEGILEKGYVTTNVDTLINYARNWFIVANDFWVGMLCG